MGDNSPFRLGASRSIYYSLTDELPDLTEEEKLKLETVMRKAEEFEAEEVNKMRQPLEGQLYKYTNVVRGWQYRWFVLTPDTGMLEYYMVDEKKKNRPRGALHLAGAGVTLSEEDKQSFVVSAVCGEVFKLKASDAKEKQYWVDRILSVIDKYSQEALEITSKADSNLNTPEPSFAFCKSPTFSGGTESSPATPSHTISENTGDLVQEKPQEKFLRSMNEIKESVYKAVACQKILAKSIEKLPFSGPTIKCSDRNLLLIKATSQAAVQSLEQCFLILRRCKQ